MLISEGKKKKGHFWRKNHVVVVFMSVKYFSVNPEKGSGPCLTCLDLFSEPLPGHSRGWWIEWKWALAVFLSLDAQELTRGCHWFCQVLNLAMEANQTKLTTGASPVAESLSSVLPFLSPLCLRGSLSLALTPWPINGPFLLCHGCSCFSWPVQPS